MIVLPFMNMFTIRSNFMDLPVLRSPFKRVIHPFQFTLLYHLPFKKGDSTYKKGDLPFKKSEWKGEKGDSPFKGRMKVRQIQFSQNNQY
jgi:hypothetical protein